MCAHTSVDDVPQRTRNWFERSLLIFGHLAGWAVMYALGITLALGMILDIRATGPGLVFVGLCSHAGYLLDRVKFRDADLDPADLQSDPRRHQFLRKWARPLRIVMYTEWVGASVVGTVYSPVLGFSTFAGILAGYLYSGWKPCKRPRLKDVPGIKAGLVSAAIVGLALLGTLGFHTSGTDNFLHALQTVSWLSWIHVLGVWVIVFGDAVICDLDDSESDARYSTKSLPVLFGSTRASAIAILLLVLGGVAVTYGRFAGTVVPNRLLLVGLIVVSGAVILKKQPRRDWIDARMLVIVLVVLLIG